ncbi:MAG: M20/M25/M40 family metallo-hydrolase, partial [Opitutaceae bacterium]
MFDPVEKLKEFIGQPSVSTDSKHAEGMRGAREFVADLLRELGFAVEIAPSPRHPLVFAQRGGDPGWPHVAIYGHYDVQPADPAALWKTPPFEATVVDGRIYGRGAADNKGPLLANIAAVARLLEDDPGIPLRITFLVEGEEEIGSPSFPSFLGRYRDRLKEADFVYLSDTQSPRADQVAITCGMRGLALFDLQVIGPNMDLHSGLHGGVLRNPIQALAEICAGLHAPDGRVDVPGFYEGIRPVEDWERAEVGKLGLDEAAYREFLGVDALHMPPGFSPAEAIRFQPTLEFNGVGGGYQGEGSKT